MAVKFVSFGSKTRVAFASITVLLFCLYVVFTSALASVHPFLYMHAHQQAFLCCMLRAIGAHAACNACTVDYSMVSMMHSEDNSNALKGQPIGIFL